MARKLKTPVVALPQSRGEADTLLGTIGELTRQLDAIDSGLTAEVARRTEAAKAEAAPLAAELGAAVKALSAWAHAHRDELLADGLRSVRLAHGQIGWRATPPAVHLDEGAEEGVIATLQKRRLTQFLRVTTELDKQAILKAPERIAGIAGIEVRGGEYFFAVPMQVSTEVRLTGKRVKRHAVEQEAA